jgi:peroxiredoxin
MKNQRNPFLLNTIITAFLCLSLSCNVYAEKVYKSFQEAVTVTRPYSSIETELNIGDAVPDFALPDASRGTVKLSDYRNQQPVLLVFYRGSWCPFCVSHLEDIQNLFPTLDRYNVQLLAISPDDIKKSTQLALKFNKPYVFLSDKNLKVANQYGVKRNKKLPHPAVFLIDREGKLLWYHIDQQYRTRASAIQLKKILQEAFEKN